MMLNLRLIFHSWLKIKQMLNDGLATTNLGEDNEEVGIDVDETQMV